MGRRHGVWRCVCDCEIYAKPTKGSRKNHDKLTAPGVRDHLGRWVYEQKNDRFLHMHGGKIGLLKADFVEDRDEDKKDAPSKGGGGQFRMETQPLLPHDDPTPEK